MYELFYSASLDVFFFRDLNQRAEAMRGNNTVMVVTVFSAYHLIRHGVETC